MNQSAKVVIVVLVQAGEIASVKAETFRDQPSGAMQLCEREMIFPKAHHFRGAIGRLLHRVKLQTMFPDDHVDYPEATPCIR